MTPLPAVTSEEFAAAMAELGPVGPMAVAVSGGGDSLALMFLLKDWAAAQGRSGPFVFCVDHGMRAEAAREAKAVARRARAAGLEAAILHDPSAEKPASNIQSVLRDLRYRLLAEACAKRGIGDLFLGHTLDDQAETFLQRLARGSGVDGLAAMAASAPSGALKLSSAPSGALKLRRPLLGISRARLRETLRDRNEDWIDDPSNDDSKHDRVRWRRLMPLLAEQGLTAERLARTATAMQRARLALEEAAIALIRETVIPEPYGSYLIDPLPIAAAEEEIGLRALAMLFRRLGGGPPLRLERTLRLHAQLIAGLPQARTLQGCRILPFRNGARIVREFAAAAEPMILMPGQIQAFDRRFEVQTAKTVPHGLRIEVLGPMRWRDLKAFHGVVPPAAGPVLPAIVDIDGLRAVPHLGFFRADSGPKEVMITVLAPGMALGSGSDVLV